MSDDEKPEGAHDPSPSRASLWIVLAAVAGIVVGSVGTWLLWLTPWPNATLYWREFSTSAGLGGVAALLAALIAYRASIRNADMGLKESEKAREDERKAAIESQWWENYRWAMGALFTTREEYLTAEDEAALEDLVPDGADRTILVDPDTAGAIALLEHLGEAAPRIELKRLIQHEIFGAILGEGAQVRNASTEDARGGNAGMEDAQGGSPGTGGSQVDDASGSDS